MRLGKRLYSLVMFLVVSVLGGLLAAGLLVPAAGMTAEAGKGAATALDSLPAELATTQPAERSTVLMADGSTLVNFYVQNRQYVPLSKISKVMQQAQIAIEDHRFYQHGALDLQGTLRALISTARGNTQGASTLTQQYVRYAQVYAAEERGDTDGVAKAQENTLSRKIQELRYALALEKKFSKDEILERYLNVAYYGDGAYGVQAAAYNYFGIPASKLNLQQAAMLAGMVRNPVGTNPRTSGLELVALQRRNDVLDRMSQSDVHVITPAQAAKAKASKLGLSKPVSKKQGCANSKYPFICDFVEKTLANSPSLGKTKEERINTLYRGGLTIKLTVDPKNQNKAEKTITNYLDPRDPLDSAINMIEPGTGKIIAMAQNRTKMGTAKGETYYNYSVTQAMGGGAGYQGGSTFKMFVAAAALKNGLGAYGMIDVKSRMNFGGWKFTSCEGTFPAPSPWNVVGSAGRMNMFEGVTRSVNGYFVQLEAAANLCDVTKLAKAMGLEPGTNDRDLVKYYSNIASFTLGAVEVAPLTLVNSYATIAARGIHCDPIIITSIKSRDGTALEVPSANCKRVMDEGIADALSLIFQGPFNSGTARPADIPGYQIAGKTGTVSDNRAIWTIGFTRNLAAGAVISYSSDPRFRKFWSGYRKQVYIKNAYMKYSGVRIAGNSGGEAGGRLLKPAMRYVLDRLDKPKGFVRPPGGVLAGEKINVPYCSGVENCKSVLMNAGFGYYFESIVHESPKGTFLGVGTGRAVRGTSIAIRISAGAPKKEETEKPSESPSSSPSPSPSKPNPKPTKTNR